jgi:hypothetical protein
MTGARYLTTVPTTVVWSLLIEWDYDDEFCSFMSSRQSLHRSKERAQARVNEVVFEITGGCRPDEIETLAFSERDGNTFADLAVGLKREPRTDFSYALTALEVEP